MTMRVTAAVARIGRCVWADPWLFAELAFWRISLPILKRVVPVDRLARMLWSPRLGDDDAREVTTLVNESGRLFLSANCLERSLVWYRLFSRLGMDPHLVMGARRDDDTLAGHVWIELNGEPFGEPDAARYAIVVVFAKGGERLMVPGVSGTT